MRLLYIALLLSALSFGQDRNGISYQALILNPQGEQLPGANNNTVPMANTEVCLRFHITTNAGSYNEYSERQVLTTDAYGMINTVVGTGAPVGTIMWNQIVWTEDSKGLKVEIDYSGECSSFVALSSQELTSVPFALYSPASNIPGPPGEAGDSAYQVWIDEGNTGTEQEFLDSLKGTDGEPGDPGADGDSAYQLWIDEGNTGTEQEFLDSLKGTDGDPGEGTEGKSAYEVWIELGNTGTEQDFIAALSGPKGDPGLDGAKSLIKTSLEESGSNCINGGVKVEVGEDANADGVLDTDEVDDSLTRYVCNGIDGEDGEDGGGSSGLGNVGVFSSSTFFTPVGKSLSADGSTIAIVDVYYSNQDSDNNGYYDSYCKLKVFQIGNGSLNQIGQQILLPWITSGNYNVKLNSNGSEFWLLGEGQSNGFIDTDFVNTSKKYSLSQGQWVIDSEWSFGQSKQYTMRFSDDLQTLVSSGGIISKFINGSWVEEYNVSTGGSINYDSFDINSNGSVVAFKSDAGTSTNGISSISVYQKINDNWQIVGNTITVNDWSGSVMSITNEGLTIAFSATEDLNQDGDTSNYEEKVIKAYEFINGAWSQKGSTIISTDYPGYGDISTNFKSLKIHNSGNTISCLSSFSIIGTTVNQEQLKLFSFNNGDWGSTLVGFQENFQVGYLRETHLAEASVIAFFNEAFENQAGGLHNLIITSLD